ncbi:MAG TPA: hypothetical protein P5556_00960 [Candidatus Gastranaerophilales bacterium]|nr:hypothetical protein [Candidatus Gastranaerophilales bacterium]
MPKYKVKGTDILHNKVLHPDGSTIQLAKDEAERLIDHLEFLEDDPEVFPQETGQTAQAVKTENIPPQTNQNNQRINQDNRRPFRQNDRRGQNQRNQTSVVNAPATQTTVSNAPAIQANAANIPAAPTNSKEVNTPAISVTPAPQNDTPKTTETSPQITPPQNMRRA